MPRSKKVDKNKKRVEALQDLQHDHEQFLLAFEKPTQIYRFLRARQILSPTFMHRNLLYVRDRCSRTNARRKKFAVKDLLNAALANDSTLEQADEGKNHELRVAVTGLALDPSKKDSNIFKSEKILRRVDVEVVLVRTLLNKRKDLDLSAKESSYGVLDIPVNPRANSESANPFDNEDGIIVIPASDFVKSSAAEGATKSYLLRFRISEAASDSDSDESDSSGSDDVSDEGTCHPKRKKKSDGGDEEENEEGDPAGISLKNLTTGLRKRKAQHVRLKQSDQKKDGPGLSGSGPEANTRSRDTKNTEGKGDMKQKVCYYKNANPPTLKKHVNADREIISEVELLLFNSDIECQADSGNYELVVAKKDNDMSEYKRKAVWESFEGGREVKVYGSFSSPTLKLTLDWCRDGNPGPLAGSDGDGNTSDNLLISMMPGRQTRKAILTTKESLTNGDVFLVLADNVEYRKGKIGQKNLHSTGITNGSENTISQNRVFYQFMYNNNAQQQTESRDDFYCPWCQLNCMMLYGLMKHLKLCHPRLLFRYSQHNKGTNIIVTVNECYDGSYAGNPQNIFCQPGMAFRRRGPVRRIPVTDVLVYKPQRKPMDSNCSLAELLDKEDVEALEPTQLSSGHRRLYFHSLTSLPIRPCEFDNDSEEEATEPDWLSGHTKRMIDEFTDVNEGEKALMKIWNLHVMRNSCISDTQMENVCKKFIDENISHMAKHSLRRNMLLHLICLVDFGVFKTSSVLMLMDYFDKVKREYLEANPSCLATDAAKELTSNDFPEADLLPRIKNLQDIIAKSK